MMSFEQGPMHGCGCHPRPPIRYCRQEAKELLVQGDKANAAWEANPADQTHGTPPILKAQPSDQAIIGGGCCVQLSVEYMPANLSLQDQDCFVIVEVQDSEGSTLGWTKQFKEGYHVKECIITTYPGAKLSVIVKNAIARVRWCEIFSC
jgi:hypothetical protein